jgi:hypothetical protein
VKVSSLIYINKHSARFKVLTEVSMKMIAFWDIAPCSSVVVDRHFKDAYCHYHQGDDSSSLARQPYMGPAGLPQKLLPADVYSYRCFRFRDKSLFQGGVVSSTPYLQLSWRADVFYEGCLP